MLTCVCIHINLTPTIIVDLWNFGQHLLIELLLCCATLLHRSRACFTTFVGNLPEFQSHERQVAGEPLQNHNHEYLTRVAINVASGVTSANAPTSPSMTFEDTAATSAGVTGAETKAADEQKRQVDLGGVAIRLCGY